MASPSDWFTRLRADAREVMTALRPHGVDAMFSPTAPLPLPRRTPASPADADVRMLTRPEREPARSGR